MKPREEHMETNIAVFQLMGCHCDYISSEKHKDSELGPGRNNADISTQYNRKL